ncbi:MAG: hypothetical protein ACTSSH_08760, partial [Candidatus Heimdallarchaeota archaeon]
MNLVPNEEKGEESIDNKKTENEDVDNVESENEKETEGDIQETEIDPEIEEDEELPDETVK